jgi:hypothetical protein
MFYLFRLDVAYILQWIHMCFFLCFGRMLQVFCKYSSGCFKSKSSVARIAIGPTYRRACAWEAERWRWRAQEAERDGGGGTGGPFLCVQ